MRELCTLRCSSFFLSRCLKSPLQHPLPALFISPCCVYTLLPHLTWPSGCPLHFVIFRHRDRRVDVEGETKKREISSLLQHLQTCFLSFSITLLLFLPAPYPSHPPSISISIWAHSSVGQRGLQHRSNKAGIVSTVKPGELSAETQRLSTLI